MKHISEGPSAYHQTPHANNDSSDLKMLKLIVDFNQLSNFTRTRHLLQTITGTQSRFTYIFYQLVESALGRDVYISFYHS